MAELKDNDHESISKRKKRQRVTTVLEKEDKISRLQYEEDYAEGYLNKLVKELDETLFPEILPTLSKIESNAYNIKEQFEKVEMILKGHGDLLWEFLGFLEPYQALECGRLMAYYEISSMKQFIRNLMSHFKRQPHLLKKVIDKLCYLAEYDGVQQGTVEEEIAPLLQKNSVLMQQFLRLLPVEKNLEWYFHSDDTWEDFSIDTDVYNEEIFDISHASENINVEAKVCIYGCKKKNKSSLCPLCSLKFINGRMYIANGRMLRPANLIFDPSEEAENTKRLAEKSDFFTPLTTRTRVHKRVDVNKDSNEGSYSPFNLGTESEEELGENDLPRRKPKRRNTQRLKVRFETAKKKVTDIGLADQTQTDDTAASNDDGSCDDTSKEDNDNNEDVYAQADLFSEDMELNISATSTPQCATIVLQNHKFV